MSSPTIIRPAGSRPGVRRLTARAGATIWLALVAVTAWLRAEAATDDRGSDSTEKALMVILGITVGTAVTTAAVIFVATKTALFK